MSEADIFVGIECSDHADAEALKKRTIEWLKQLDKGDYSGREVYILTL